MTGQRFILNEAEPLFPDIGVCAQKKRGQQISGDSGTYFKTENGILTVIMSDGMGSGREAALESGVAVRLLERFLRAGIKPLSAMRTLNSALLLKNGEQYGLTTVDLMRLNLFSQEI
jgi:stage II sporulation protein E